MKTKKIIHIITTIERGGAEIQLLTLAQKQIERENEVEIFYLKGKPELANNFKELGVSINSTLANKSLIIQIFLFRSLIHKNNFLVHAHLPQAELVAASACKNKRFVITRHNFEPFWPNKPRIISVFLSRYTSNRAASIIAISNAIKEYSLVCKEISKKVNITVVHYGFAITNSKVTNKAQIVHPELEDHNAFKIGTIGRLVPGKNYFTMLSSIKLTLDKIPNMKFFIVGTGKSETDLKKLCKDMQIESSVIWLGKTAYVHEFLRKIDLFIFASNGEGFGLALLEAMQANKPILAPRNSAIPEVLGVGYLGLYPTGDHKSLADKILYVNSELRSVNELTSGFKSQLKLFDSDIMADRIIQVYESVGF
jgi:glycosyltransferase involved in cell wall biosynthesis